MSYYDMHVLWAHTQQRLQPLRPRFSSSSPELSAVWSAFEMQLIMQHNFLIDSYIPLCCNSEGVRYLQSS